jgi:hypothetical protein
LGRGHAVHRALRKYGSQSVVLEVLLYADDLDFLKNIEKSAIETFGTKSPHGYNMTAGGDGFIALDHESIKTRTATLMGDANRIDRWKKSISSSWSNEKRRERSDAVKALWQSQYGDDLRKKHQIRRKAPTLRLAPSKEIIAARKRASWTPDKRQAQALRIAEIGRARAAEVAATQRQMMADPARRLQIAQKLSRHADALFITGRKPLRGGFTRHIWDQIPNPATFEQLFALGFSKGRLGKALKNGNIVRCDGGISL